VVTRPSHRAALGESHVGNENAVHNASGTQWEGSGRVFQSRQNFRNDLVAEPCIAPQVALDRTTVVATVGGLVPGAMAQHVTVNQESELSCSSSPSDHALMSSGAEW
jgi:hypothetical protein